jgi:Protein of unknown function (DUF2849)
MLRVISANRLRDGAVVYLGGQDRWVETFARAFTFEDEPAFEAGLLQAREDERANVVLDIAPVDVVRDGAAIRPAHIRERIRAAGPTVHRDHGKQADGAPTRELERP